MPKLNRGQWGSVALTFVSLVGAALDNLGDFPRWIWQLVLFAGVVGGLLSTFFALRGREHDAAPEDTVLATRAETLAEEIFAAHTEIEHRQSARHAIRGSDWHENVAAHLSDSAAAATRYQARVQAVFSAAHNRGLKLDFKMMSGMEHGHLHVWARALSLLAEALRNGAYRGKTLTISPFEQRLD